MRTFTAGQPPLIIKPAYLRCGNASWGYRHIQARHMNDWNNVALLVGADWRLFADFAILTSLVNSYRVVNQLNNPTMYKGIIQIKEQQGSGHGHVLPCGCARPAGRQDHHHVPNEQQVGGNMASPDLDTFATDLTAGLADVGIAHVADDGTVSIAAKSDGTRIFTFAESVDEIRRRITIDDAAWHSMWPDWTLEKASIAMFSVHVQEAIDTAPDSATTLTLVEGGIVAG